MRIASVRVLERRLGGDVLRHAGFHVAAPALVVGLRGVVGQRDRGFGADRHLGELELDRLMLGDRLAEGLAQLRVAHRFVERRLGDAAAARRDVDAAELEPAERRLQAAALRAADQRGRPARGSPRRSARRSRCPCSRSSPACARRGSPAPSRPGTCSCPCGAARRPGRSSPAARRPGRGCRWRSRSWCR